MAECGSESVDDGDKGFRFVWGENRLCGKQILLLLIQILLRSC